VQLRTWQGRGGRRDPEACRALQDGPAVAAAGGPGSGRRTGTGPSADPGERGEASAVARRARDASSVITVSVTTARMPSASTSGARSASAAVENEGVDQPDVHAGHAPPDRSPRARATRASGRGALQGLPPMIGETAADADPACRARVDRVADPPARRGSARIDTYRVRRAHDDRPKRRRRRRADLGRGARRGAPSNVTPPQRRGPGGGARSSPGSQATRCRRGTRVRTGASAIGGSRRDAERRLQMQAHPPSAARRTQPRRAHDMSARSRSPRRNHVSSP